MKRPEITLGIWAAILSAIFALLWFITFSLQDAIHQVPQWKNLGAYAEAFRMVRLTYVYPSLLLALTYIILLACVHRLAAEEKKLWTLIGLAVGIVYAVMASINYNIQAVAVRLSLNAGETQGISMFLPDNTHSIFSALANSYVYLAISMVFLGFLFGKGKLERWIRGLLLAQIITAAGQIGYSMLDMREGLFIATSMVWIVGAPAAFILIARWLKRGASAHQPA